MKKVSSRLLVVTALLLNLVPTYAADKEPASTPVHLYNWRDYIVPEVTKRLRMRVIRPSSPFTSQRSRRIASICSKRFRCCNCLKLSLPYLLNRD